MGFFKVISLECCRAVLLLAVLKVSWADVSHYFAPDYGLYQQHPFQVAPPPPPPPPQSSFQGLYAPPPTQQSLYPYPNPVQPAPAPVQTPSPVAPVSTTTEFTLPEVVENRIAKERNNFIPLHSQYLPPDERPPHAGGYYYPRPTATTTTTTLPPPLTQDPIIVLDPPDLSPPLGDPSLVGPPFNAPAGPPGYDYNAPPPPSPLPPVVIPLRPPPSTPAPAYLPPTSNAVDDQQATVVEHLDPSVPPLRLHVKEMRCLQHQGGYFRSVLKVHSFIGAAPSVDNDAYDKRCEVKLSRSYVVLDIGAEDFHKCGVHACGSDLCLRLRFPAIRGMRTSADAILMLHCRTQERVAAKTHALKMGVANDIQARSVGTYARGGSQNPFRTHIELLRKSGNGFTRHLETNGAVQLGEDLLLRAHVLPGDGWNHTKLTDVSLQRISASGELLNNANLITTRGCVNPSMQSVCTQPPTFDPPLGHRLAFKAVMFQGMRSGEELVMSMRITGCLEPQDCYMNAQECDTIGVGRRRRSAMEADFPQSMRNGTEISELTRISFRVVMPEAGEMEEASGSGDEAEMSEIVMKPRNLLFMGSLGFVGLLTCVGAFAVLKLKN